MTVLETVVIFVGIPAAVIAVIAGLVYGAGARRSKRYRPGRPFEFTPVWFLAQHDRAAAMSSGYAIGGGERVALPAAGNPAEESASAHATGGARGTW
jgi:hypothetical protein